MRLALSLLHGGADALAGDLIRSAAALSPEKTLEDIDRLYCGETYRERLRAMART